MAKQKIPCRVCGKLFEPCAYCKAHEDVFRWRNFACSRECAAKYIENATAYRESLKTVREKESKPLDGNEHSVNAASTEKTITARKKTNKKVSDDAINKSVEEKKETD